MRFEKWQALGNDYLILERSQLPFELSAARIRKLCAGHFGVSGMRERAKRIGGKLDVWTATGAGTEIELSIPASIAYGTSPGRTFLGLFRKKAANS